MGNRIDTARTLLRRVVGLARTALVRDEAPAPGAARPAPQPAAAPPPPAEAAREPAAQKAPPPATELNEPIQTRTLARLLTSQGHLSRALSIYDKLLALHPADASLRDEAERIREACRETLPPGEADEIVSVPVEDGGVLLSWEVSEAGIQRAQRLLSHTGTLTARIVVVAPDSEKVVRSTTRERSVQKTGEWLLDALPDGARATASVGLLCGERFVSIAHARTLRA